MALFIAMNHFQVDPARGAEFEAHWRQRETYLAEVPGFLRFALLRGDEPGRLRLALDLAEPRRLRSLDALRGLPQGARAGAHSRRPAERASAARAVRSRDRELARWHAACVRARAAPPSR